MATQATTVDGFQLLLAECSDAIAAEDWKTAYSKYAQAEAVHAALEKDISDGAASITRRDTLDGLMKALDKVSAFVGKSTKKNRSFKIRTDFRR